MAKDMYSEDMDREWPECSVVPPRSRLICKSGASIAIEYWRGSQGAGLANVCAECAGVGYGDFADTVARFVDGAWWLSPGFLSYYVPWMMRTHHAGLNPDLLEWTEKFCTRLRKVVPAFEEWDRVSLEERHIYAAGPSWEEAATPIAEFRQRWSEITSLVSRSRSPVIGLWVKGVREGELVLTVAWHKPHPSNSLGEPRPINVSFYLPVEPISLSPG